MKLQSANSRKKGNEKAQNLENQDENQISNQVSEVANDTARELSPLHSQHPTYEAQNQGLPQIQMKNHQLALFHSQSLPAPLHSGHHLVDDHDFFHTQNQHLANIPPQ